MASRHYGSHLTDSDGQPFQNVAIGLDFGTSNTSMAISNNAKVNILRNDRREIVTPSVVAFDEERILIGNEATASSIKPENIIWGMKRFLGRSCNDLKKNYENQSFSISYNQTNPRILVQDKQLHVQQIVAILFSKLMAPIEGRYRVLPRVVLTVPSSFGHSQRKALTDAAKIAEIDVLQLIEETTAAAIAFACKKTLEQSRNILIFHLGGGCFDVAIFRIAGHSIELLSSVASSDIGGINFTQHIVDYVFEKTGSSNDKSCFKTLKQVIAACEEAKQKLSDIKDTKIKIDMNEPFSRRQFETRSKQLREIINWAIKFALSIARLSSEEIDNYFMIGKSTMMPCIKGTLKKHFNKSKKKDIMNADDAAVCGAAILAESITKQSETNFHVSNNVNKRKITIADGKVSSYCCQEDTFHDSVASALLEGLIDDVKQLVESDHNLNVEFTIQERHLQEGCRETRHYRKDTERSDCKSVLKSQRLFEMAMEVKAYLKADRNWLEIDKRKTTLLKDIHKTEYVIKELLRQAAHRSSFKNDVRVLQKKFQGFSDRISQMESLSVDELEKGEELGAKLRKDVDELKSKIDNTVTATTSTSFGSRTNSSSHAIGIDLGTANSCVATVVDGRVEVIENDCRNLVTPSCVTFTGGRTLIGQPERDPANTYNIKRTMRRMFDDSKKKEDKKIKGSTTRRKVGVKSCEKTYSFEEIGKLVLKYMRQIACDKLDEDVCDAVVTIPACFNHMQRSATKTAAELAGLNLLGIINEPTAAAIAFGLENECPENRNLLIYDFGGGSVDVTVLCINGSKVDVKASSGNAYLGGDDLTRCLMGYFLKRLRTKQERALRKDRCAMNNLWMECEKAKIKLSTEHAYKLLGNNIRADIKLTKSIKRTKFVSLSSDVMDKTIDYVKDALKESGMKKGEIDFVLPIGGSSKIPYVIKKLEKYFGKDVIKEIRSSDQMTAKGAAIYASFLKRHPIEKTTVDLSEVTPLSFGIKLPNGMTSILIRRNTKIPVARSKTYSKSNNGQEYSTIQICQGEKKRFKHNEYLGDISVKIPPKQRAKVKILIEFNLNANGILNAKAGVEGGESKSIVINLWNTSDKLDTGNRREKPILEREHYKGLQETAF